LFLPNAVTKGKKIEREESTSTQMKRKPLEGRTYHKIEEIESKENEKL